MKLKCLCCGFEETFIDAEEAFRSGWDAPPHFTLVCCRLCPASFLVLGESHAADHKRWEKNGRPKEFEIPRDENERLIL